MVLLAVVTVLAAGCGGIKKTTRVPVAELRPSLEATADQLVERYNQQARAVRSLNAGVELSPVTGSQYTGVIEDYHDVSGFILAQKPASIRMIGQAPVVAKNIFDMVSDGETFRIFIPSKNKFVVGPTKLERPSKQPIENLRPQHLLDALFWRELPAGRTILIEEFDAMPQRYYILTQVREADGPEIDRKIWFDRADLNIARMQIFGARGRIVADIRYADWQPAGELRYPRHVWLVRPHDDYQLEVRITKLTLNEDIAADRFRLEQPPGTELVRVGDEGEARRP
jgi:outer membrane lipoprotein-sorting protein